MPRLEPKHPLPTRVFHWLNGPLLLVMIASGMLIYWAHDVYAIRVGPYTIFKFFPASFYRALHQTPLQIDHRLAQGLGWHFAFMWFFAINGLLYVAYTFWSGEWRFLLPDRSSPAEAWEVVKHDLGIRKAPLPRKKFNGAQRIAYTGVVAMGAGSLLTGLAIYKPVQVAWLTSLLGGYVLARQWHFLLTIGYVLFFVVHITEVIRAGWNNFRAMVTGYELAGDQEPPHDPARSRRPLRAEPALAAPELDPGPEP